ncbi:uncharacterized protein KY384_007346 [Bacidia gigantensis]|uniref:uncharacterized protein n=1 Tax=Bacidia gigantensis TaxID=2732470 RepID=UPI001D056FA5|nr:uncharacterized protein KY384_007346 [Bacidia gigantensis]KAG8528428.1 hypothetical protein KY384_007346 [Bacidia gigantensis]
MSANFSTIAILGATSGLGEGFARRFHAEGKTIIATGRRLFRLQSLQRELPGLQIQEMDTSSITTLPTQISQLLTTYPDIDTVITMAGIQKFFTYKDPTSTSMAEIQLEISTNLTAPAVIAHAVIPFFLAQNRPTTFVTVSSGLAFVPAPVFPVYCATKAAIHMLSVSLRAQLHGTNVSVLELAPPYVDTALDMEHREDLVKSQGGEEKAVKPMGLEQYLDAAMERFEAPRSGEVAVGFAEMGAGKWREAFGPILGMMGTKG